jgi:hypothetical protein
MRCARARLERPRQMLDIGVAVETHKYYENLLDT